MKNYPESLTTASQNVPETDQKDNEESYGSYSKEFVDKLITQINREYNEAFDHITPKITEWLKRLKLYNNQRRDKKATGDTSLYTTFQTLFASLYDDRLGVTFTGKKQGDSDVAENLDGMAEYDYDEMEMDELEFEWSWDALFFGHSLLCFSKFDRDTLTPLAEVWDPTVTLYDPDATSVHGNKLGVGAAGFLGRVILLTKNDTKDEKGYFNTNLLRDERDINSLIMQAQRARRDAQGTAEVNATSYGSETDITDNQMKFEVLQWFTIVDGKKYMVELGNQRKLCVRIVELKGNYFPLVDRQISPIPHDWSGVSIADLVEDKQRHRAVILNLLLKIVRSGLYPALAYDTNKITNRNDLNLDSDKRIPVDGDPSNAFFPVVTPKVDSNMVSFMLDALDNQMQKATATPEIQQGIVSKDQRTATELNLVNAKVDTRYSLSVKIFGMSARRMWRMWYWVYKNNFTDIDEKSLQVNGAFGPKWRTLTKKEIVATVDPKITIESRILADAARQRKRADLLNVSGLLLQDPTLNKRYLFKLVLTYCGYKKDDIDRLMPPTIDEMIAEKENESLNENEFVTVKVDDDHQTHLEIHRKAADTDAMYAHVESHKEAMMYQRNNPEQFPQVQQQRQDNLAIASNSANSMKTLMQGASLPGANGGAQ